MQFPLSHDVASRLYVPDTTASTNDDLRVLAATESVPEFTVIATMRQTAGRGRLGRQWKAPPGTSLAASVLLRPRAHGVGVERYGWIPLIAGLAMTRTVQSIVGNQSVVGDRGVTLKWPNDVLIGGRKVCGVLSELSADHETVIVGAGLNLSIPNDSLPTPTATSLALNGVTIDVTELADLALSRYLHELKSLWESFTAHGDADRHDATGTGSSEIHGAVTAACGTLGSKVRVALPDGSEQVGTAVDLDETGRLRVRVSPSGPLLVVAAGDVTHLRYE